MKKALQISIAKTLFTVEEDAYSALEAYLRSIEAHFKAADGSDEIVGDIEGRIAEQLLEAKEQVITLTTVERVLERMGRVEDFDDSETLRTEAPSSEAPRTKKLYRNPDDLYVAGVASGLAAYFGIEVVIMRAIFFVLALFNGFGILLYIVLWIVMPEAKTNAQKLEMTGTPVTLATLSETVKERVEELSERNGRKWQRLITLPFRLIGMLIRLILQLVGPLVRIVVGLALSVWALFALVGTLIFAGFLASENTGISQDIPLETLLPGASHLTVLFGAALAVIIPALFVLIAGISILRRKSSLTLPIALGMLGVWFAALVITGFGASKIVNNYQEFVRTSPDYQMATSTIALPSDLRALALTDGVQVTVVKGDEPSLLVEGRRKDLASLLSKAEDGTLALSRERQLKEDFCLFCMSRHVAVTLTVADLNEVSVTNGSSLMSADFPQDGALALHVDRGSRADIEVGNAELAADVDQGSRLTLSGTARSATVRLDHGSSLEAEGLTASTADIRADNGSNARLYATEKLVAEALHGSSIYYRGSPSLEKKSGSGSSIRAFDYDENELRESTTTPAIQ